MSGVLRFIDDKFESKGPALYSVSIYSARPYNPILFYSCIRFDHSVGRLAAHVGKYAIE